MKNFDVVIVGAGPAGLFTAYELKEKKKDLKVCLIDLGKRAENRVCPMKQGHKCMNCNPCQILSGFGGAGTFSDGKLNFIPKLGKSDLFKYMSESDAYKIIDDTEEIFNKFGMDAEIYPKSTEKSEEIKREVTLKTKLQEELFNLIRELNSYIINKNSNRIRQKNIKDFLVSLSMCDFYLEYVYLNRIISFDKYKFLVDKIITIKKLAYGMIKDEKE